jgi:cytochrome c oxidase subunit III
MAEQQAVLAPQFDSLEQQREARTLGMWVFLATEVLFFGGLFAGYTAYRTLYTADFAAASRHTVLWLGGPNTAVLLCSSLTMALAVRAVRLDHRRALVTCLVLTALLGATFLGLKGLEYYKDYHDHLVPGVNFVFTEADAGHAALFFLFYFFMTGLHAIHLTIAVCLVTILAILSWRGHFAPDDYTPVELIGLFWHFVDIVWVFLLPLLYLIGRY